MEKSLKKTKRTDTTTSSHEKKNNITVGVRKTVSANTKYEKKKRKKKTV